MMRQTAIKLRSLNSFTIKRFGGLNWQPHDQNNSQCYCPHVKEARVRKETMVGMGELCGQQRERPKHADGAGDNMLRAPLGLRMD